MIAVTHLLDPILRCASRRCGVVVHGFDADDFLGVFSCTRCGSRMLATRFHVGASRTQLVGRFGDDPFVDTVMVRYSLPLAFKLANWLSIWIPNDDYRLYRTDVDAGAYARTRNLLRRLTPGA